MHMFKNAFVASVLSMSLLSFGVAPAVSQDASCDASLTGIMIAVINDSTIASEGIVTITGCDQMVMTFEDGRTVNVADVFEHQSGRQFFEANITFVAQNFFPAVPDELLVQDQVFRLAPSLDAITAERSDLALNYQTGAADTVFFKFKDGDNVRFLKIVEVEGIWELDLS